MVTLNLQGKLKLIFRQYQRLLRIKTADSGSDPAGAYKEFMAHDIVKPLEKIIENNDIDNMKEFLLTRNEKWALKTTKISASPSKLPNLQPFKTFFFPRNDISNKSENHVILKTDHISQIPNLKKAFNNSNVSSPKFLDLKSK